jgi:hypothetical protein
MTLRKIRTTPTKCQACGRRAWCAVTTASGHRRCFDCWLAYYRRREAQGEALLIGANKY